MAELRERRRVEGRLVMANATSRAWRPIGRRGRPRATTGRSEPAAVDDQPSWGCRASPRPRRRAWCSTRHFRCNLVLWSLARERRPAGPPRGAGRLQLQPGLRPATWSPAIGRGGPARAHRRGRSWPRKTAHQQTTPLRFQLELEIHVGGSSRLCVGRAQADHRGGVSTCAQAAYRWDRSGRSTSAHLPSASPIGSSK